MSIDAVKISDALYHYLVAHSVKESDLSRRLREATLKLPGGKMIAAPEQVNLITFLIKLIGAKSIIEIGTFTGYTTLAMAQACDAQARIITCDVNCDAPQLGQKFWLEAGVAYKIELVINHGLILLDELVLQDKHKTIDFAFIDADKKNNFKYYKKLLTLLRQGGLLVVDNVLWKGRVLQKPHTKEVDEVTRSIQHFNDFVAQDERVETCIIPLGDGLTLARKK